MTRIGLVALLITGSAGPLLAQDRPVLKPTRDVVVVYRSIGGGDGQAVTVKMEWSEALRSLRMDVPGIGWSVADHRSGKGFIVMEEAKRIMDMPAIVHASQLGPTPEATMERGGAATIAGLTCTQWRYRDANGEGTTCLTADGVMLRTLATQSGITGGSEAVSVSFGAVAKERFVPPEGYARVQARQPRNRPAP
jgi:hypothetical protein